MTVKQLIEKLKEMPEEAEVVIVHVDWDIKNIYIDKDKVKIS